jgi:hypothetical protein
VSVPFDALHDAVFDTFGIDIIVQRGSGPAVPVRVIVRDGVARLGEFQQVIGTARHLIVQCRQWQFQRGDVASWNGQAHTVEAQVADDGYVNEAVLYG